MKKLHVLTISILLSFFLFISCDIINKSDKEIKSAARRASVQVQFHIPVMKVSFTKPLPDPEKDTYTKIELEKLISEKLQKAIEAERELQGKNKYNASLTSIEAYVQPKSKTLIPIGSIPGVPKWARFPERVLVVYKTQKNEVKPWEKDSEADVMSISETTGVSISMAKTILANLKAKGYSVSKESVTENSEIRLIWYDDGWDDNYPVELAWSVTYPGENNNMVRGYDSRGIIETSIIADDPDSYGRLKTVKIEAGYLDLQDQYKPKSLEVERLMRELNELKERYQKLLDDETAKKKKDVSKRDITNASWADVLFGTVKIQSFWSYSAASGVFLGNMRARRDFTGWGGSQDHTIYPKDKAIILTNAHVARMAISYEMYVSRDKETMWLVLPGYPSVRYTQDSDTWGSPAPVLGQEDMFILSDDYDCAILATSAVPQYEKHKAFLGDSDKVNEGDPVIMVGNPMLTQKFLTEGVVSNKNYSILKSPLIDGWLAEGFSKRIFNWLLNSSWWCDTPIGIGGTSGSGIWALSGSQQGKVVALHNMGLAHPVGGGILISDFLDVDPKRFEGFMTGKWDMPIKDFIKDNQGKLFEKDGYRKARFSKSLSGIQKTENEFAENIETHMGYIKVAGMNGAIPINPIKRFLQERGLDPEHFGFDGAGKDYWTR
uniref:Putative trypsin-like peptidase domain containing protein n=1 Tax=viral metagenome TaxID=1070528 RepID=A0A6M3LBQ2_9ZZZZ